MKSSKSFELRYSFDSQTELEAFESAIQPHIATLQAVAQTAPAVAPAPAPAPAVVPQPAPTAAAPAPAPAPATVAPQPVPTAVAPAPAPATAPAPAGAANTDTLIKLATDLSNAGHAQHVMEMVNRIGIVKLSQCPAELVMTAHEELTRLTQQLIPAS